MKYIFAILCLLSSQGCVLAPAIDSINKIGLTEADRHKLLVKRMRDYHDAIFWKKKEILQGFYTLEATPVLLKMDRDSINNEKLVEAKVDSVEYSEDTHSATVTILIKSYRIPYYVVQDRTERERWVFGYSSGWQLSEKHIER